MGLIRVADRNQVSFPIQSNSLESDSFIGRSGPLRDALFEPFLTKKGRAKKYPKGNLEYTRRLTTFD